MTSFNGNPHSGAWQITPSARNIINRLQPHLICIVAGHATVHSSRKRYLWIASNLYTKTSVKGYATSIKLAKQAAVATGWSINK